MDKYITGAVIKRLRVDKGLTQSELADYLCVSDKTISKWETGVYHSLGNIKFNNPLHCLHSNAIMGHKPIVP